MFCSDCGQKIPDDAIHCPVCGKRVNDVAVQQVVTSNNYTPFQGYNAGNEDIVSLRCPRCNYTGPTTPAYSTGWQICFCCLGLIPALIYFFLRHDKVKCGQCGKIY